MQLRRGISSLETLESTVTEQVAVVVLLAQFLAQVEQMQVMAQLPLWSQPRQLQTLVVVAVALPQAQVSARQAHRVSAS
jgi:hypothetical protein